MKTPLTLRKHLAWARSGALPDPGAPGRAPLWRSSARPGRAWPKRVLLLPTVDLLEHCFPHEIPNPVEVIVAVDDSHEVVVVAPLDPTSDGDLREDLLPRLRQGGRRHRCNARAGKHL